MSQKEAVVEQLTAFVAQYGYWLLLGIGFIEYVGFPVASMPLLVAAGATAAMGALHPVPAVLVTALGGVLGDSVWYVLARTRGRRLLGLVCALTTNPSGCIHRVTERVARIGPIYILPAKFLPGTGNLIAAAAGFSGMPARTFLPLDALALTIWASVYLGLGWIFATRVEVAIAWVVGVGRFVVLGAVLLVAVAIVIRAVKVRVHRRAHGATLPTISLPVIRSG